MGQQQLLLIVLAIIVVSVAVALANNLFDANAEESDKDIISSECVNIGMIAQQYFHKPENLGGGGKSFVGYGIPSALDSSHSAVYSIESVDSDELVIIGTPFLEKGYNWRMKSTISSEGIVTEMD